MIRSSATHVGGDIGRSRGEREPGACAPETPAGGSAPAHGRDDVDECGVRASGVRTFCHTVLGGGYGAERPESHLPVVRALQEEDVVSTAVRSDVPVDFYDYLSNDPAIRASVCSEVARIIARRSSTRQRAGAAGNPAVGGGARVGEPTLHERVAADSTTEGATTDGVAAREQLL